MSTEVSSTDSADVSSNLVSEASRTFHSYFNDYMEMNADLTTVSAYLDQHSDWFRRCAEPITVEPVGQTGYILMLGRYGALGHDIEPKIGLNLLPQDKGVYRIETIAVPNYVSVGYEVDFRATMELVEHDSNEPQTARITRVQWQLDLATTIQFPRFIQALPSSLVQATGEQLLKQIIRQVSRRLTHKVQEDFHTSHGIEIPKVARRWFFQRESDLG